MIPEDIRRFVLTSIPSIPFLEAALMMGRDRAREWSSITLAKALYVSEAVATELLAAMANAGIVASVLPGGLLFRYAPRDANTDALLDRLFECYRIDTIGTTHLIHDVTQRSALRFASAFSIRKED